MPAPYDPQQGYTYWDQAGGQGEGDMQSKFAFLPLIAAVLPAIAGMFHGGGNQQNNPTHPGNIPRPGQGGPADPNNPANYFNLQAMLGQMPDFASLLSQGLGQQGPFIQMLQQLMAQDYDRNSWMLGRAKDMYGQGQSEDDYLMNLYGDVLGIDFYSTPGDTTRTWVPDAPGGGSSGGGFPPLPNTIAAPGYPNQFTPQPPPGGWTGNTGGSATTGNPGNGGPYTPKMMEPTGNGAAGEGQAGGPGPINNLPGPTPPGGSGGPSGPSGPGGHWVENIGQTKYGWRPDPKGFDPNNPTTWGLIAPQATQAAGDRDRAIKSADAYGIRGGELDRYKANTQQDYFRNVSSMKQSLFNEARNYISQNAAKKMFGVPAGENSGAAGQGLSGLNDWMRSIMGNQSSLFGTAAGFNQNNMNQAWQNYFAQFGPNANYQGNQNQFWSNLFGGLGSVAGGLASSGVRW